MRLYTVYWDILATSGYIFHKKLLLQSNMHFFRVDKANVEPVMFLKESSGSVGAGD